MSPLHILADVIGGLLLLGLLVALALVRRAVPPPPKPPPPIRTADDFLDVLGDDIEAGHVPGVWGLDDHDPTAAPRAFDLLLDDHKTRLCLTIEALDLRHGPESARRASDRARRAMSVEVGHG